MFDIYYDTREQKPLKFNKDYIDNVYIDTFPFGDYGAKYQGKHVPVIFERKSKADLWGTLGSGAKEHDRFKRELERAQQESCNLILIIECSISDILTGHSYVKKSKKIHCKFSGLAMVRKLYTMMFNYNLQFVCCKDREEMAEYISEFYYSYCKHLNRKLNK